MPPPNLSFPMSREMNAQALMTLIRDVIDNSPNTWLVSPPFMGQGSGSDPNSGGDANAPAGDRAETDVLSYYDPVYSLVIRAPSLKNTHTGGPVGGGGAERVQLGAGDNRQLAQNPGKDKPAESKPAAGGDAQVAKKNPAEQKDIDPKQAWDLAMGKSRIHPGFVIATAHFLGQAGKFDHAAEFLKSALRHNVEVREWMYDALAMNLEMANGDPEEIEKALLSSVDRQPAASGGYLQAAAAMAKHGKWQRALEFTRQAAAQSPGSPVAYVRGLSYALSAQDAPAMKWAAEGLLGRDWPTDLDLHGLAVTKAQQLAASLTKAGKADVAETLANVASQAKVRDLVVRVTWQGEADVDLEVAEPVGTTCSYVHRQSPGGGTLLNDLSASRKAQTYSVSEAFPGEYKVTLRRAWGRTVGGKAVVEIIQHQGTAKETLRRETLVLDRDQTLTVKVNGGRRTSLAEVPDAQAYRQLAAELRPGISTAETMKQLAALATPVVRGSAGYVRADILDADNPVFQAAQRLANSASSQTAVVPTYSAGTGLAAKTIPAADGKSVRVSFEPIFLNQVTAKPQTNPLIPGGR